MTRYYSSISVSRSEEANESAKDRIALHDAAERVMALLEGEGEKVGRKYVSGPDYDREDLFHLDDATVHTLYRPRMDMQDGAEGFWIVQGEADYFAATVTTSRTLDGQAEILAGRIAEVSEGVLQIGEKKVSEKK